MFREEDASAAPKKSPKDMNDDSRPIQHRDQRRGLRIGVGLSIIKYRKKVLMMSCWLI